MSLKLIVVLLIVLAIYIGSLEQMRAVMRRPTNSAKGALQARRNTLTGDVLAFNLGINQVQGYIHQVKQAQRGKAGSAPETLKATVQAQASLDLAIAAQKELDSTLPSADSDTALQICELKLDMARFHIRNARAIILPHIKSDDDEHP